MSVSFLTRNLAIATVMLSILAINSNRLYAQAFPTGGIEVDAEGILSIKRHADPDGKILKKQLSEVKRALKLKSAKNIPLRKISLNRLEKRLAQLAAKGGQPTPEMLNLAGITRIDYVFYYPDTKDIVIAGPAEKIITTPNGRTVGVHTLRPTLKLEDLVAAMRAFPAGKNSNTMIRCSIDPTKEGLVRLQQTVRRFSRLQRGKPNQSQINRLVVDLREALGQQVVTLGGISAKTRFSKIMVEADYRMKLIGIGLEKVPSKVKMKSYVQLASGSAISKNAMQRWYFTPDYECVVMSDDGNAIQILGEGVKLIGENELVDANGRRKSTGTNNSASKKFTDGFTRQYSKLARRSPIWAELRNVIDLSIVAAYIQQKDLYGKSGWKMEFFGDESKFSIENYHAPKRVPSAANAVWKGRVLATPIGGGVSISPRQALANSIVKEDTDQKVATAKNKIIPKNIKQDQWWWDK